MTPTPEQAWELLCEFNEGDFHRRHARTVGDVMSWFARELDYGDQADLWETVGILHDLDFERWPEEHCVKSQELMRQRDIDEAVVRATASHGYGECVDIPPEHQMEKVLFAVDELTGLIGAVALMRPSKSVSDLEVKSVKKKYKDKKFAAGCSREVIERGAAMLGWELDELIGKTILAMRASPNVDRWSPLPTSAPTFPPSSACPGRLGWWRSSGPLWCLNRRAAWRRPCGALRAFPTCGSSGSSPRTGTGVGRPLCAPPGWGETGGWGCLPPAPPSGPTPSGCPA